MQKTIFREYDIRGLIGTELIIENMYDLGRAIAFYLKELNPSLKTLIIGMDPREHSSAIKEHLCRALMDSGIDVMFIGVCTSPMMYFGTYTMPVDGGIMITASHNPKEYNGLKICLGTHSLWGKDIKEIGTLYYERAQYISDTRGSYKEESLKDNYIAWHTQQFSHLKGMDMPFVIDCGNGSAAAVVPDLVKAMEWKNIQLLCSEVDGNFPNHQADPTTLKNMQDVHHLLQTGRFALGIGFDGDADRMGAMTKEGELVAGDKLIALFAQPMIKQNPGMTVVYNVVCSEGLTELLQEWGAQTVMTAVGHSVIEEAMLTYNALLAGETSCHFFFKDRHFGYDDGVYAMIRLFELLVQSKQSLQELLKVFPKKVTSPEFRIACNEENKYAMVEEIKKKFAEQQNVNMITIDGVRVTKEYGWGIIRASNTQPVLSVRCEANTTQGLQQIKEDFLQVLRPYFDNEYLRKQLQI